MSNNVLNAVWKHSHARGVNRLLLIAMADSASDEGRAWGKIETWADKVFTHERSVQYQVSKLVSIGELVVTGEYGRSKSLHFWIPLLPGEEGYNPQPCTENHRCNKNHTSLAITMEFRTRSKRTKRVQGSAPIPTQKGATSFTHSQTPQEKGAKNGTKRVQDFAERVQDFVNGEVASADQDRRDANGTIIYPKDINHNAAAISSSSPHAHVRAREDDAAAAAERDENVITQTADAVRRHLRMGRDKLPGLRLIVAQYPGARPWLENQANLCYETLKVRPLQLKHFSNWLDEYERRRNAPREGIAHEQPQQQPASPTAEHRPRAEAEGSLSGPERGAAIWAAVIASLEEDQPGSAGALLAMSGNHQRGQVSDVSRRGTGLPEMPGDALPANRDGELGDAD